LEGITFEEAEKSFQIFGTSMPLFEVLIIVTREREFLEVWSRSSSDIAKVAEAPMWLMEPSLEAADHSSMKLWPLLSSCGLLAIQTCCREPS
jgi:hypothetical protein